jgi:hypothetical protein
LTRLISVSIEQGGRSLVETLLLPLPLPLLLLLRLSACYPFT